MTACYAPTEGKRRCTADEKGMNHKKMLSWIKTHKYALAGLYLFVFLAGFALLELYVKDPKIIIHCRVDDWIPFCEWFVIPYFLWYGWVPVFLIWFLFHSRYDYLKLCFVMFVGATLCLAVYALLPNGLALRREITADNFCAEIVKMLRNMDPPYNVCPSIHVSSTVSVHRVIVQSRSFQNNHKIKWLSRVVTLAICVSTMFIKQHSVIDVICGWLLTEVLAIIYNRRHFLYNGDNTNGIV